MSRRETPIDLARAHPRIAIGGAVFLLVLAFSQNLMAAIVFAIVVASQTKKDWIDAFSTTPSGYLDRREARVDPNDEAPIERMPSYAAVTMAELDREDEEDDAWVAPPAPDEAPLDVPVTRMLSNARYGIAVPPRKPVDVPRR